MIIAGFSGYSRVLDFARFRAIADKVGACFMVDMAHVAGLVAAGVYPNRCRTPTSSPRHHAQDAARPRGGLILARANDELTKKFNSLVFPARRAAR